jgi:uncharacterized protein YciI
MAATRIGFGFAQLGPAAFGAGRVGGARQGSRGMPVSGEERIRQLTQRMLRKKLYVVLSKGAASPEQIAEILPDHLEYMIGLEKQGALFASGPLTAAAGQAAGDGLTILRAENVAAARMLAETDPFVVNKLRSFEVREWTVMEGSFGLTVNFSDQSLVIA